jgi:hypothetical protein
MKKLLGLHCLGDWYSYINHIGLWKPPVINVLSPNPDQVAEVKRLSPNTTVIGRLYKDDSYYNEQIQSRPIQFAREINDEIKAQHTSNIDYWQSVNEPTPYWDRLPALRTFTNEWMRLADQSGYKCAILAWSVGNPDLPANDPMAYWRQFYETLEYADRNRHIVMVHQYNKPNLINNVEMDDWLIWRLEKKVIPGLRQFGFSKLQFVIGEIGVDHLINSGNIGGYKATPLSDEEYVKQLLQWEQIEQQYAKNVLGSCVFTLGTQSPWDSYSISSNSNVISLLSTYYANNANKYDDQIETNLPYIPNEKETENVDIRISEGAKKLGVKVHSMTPQDEWVYEVKDIWTTQDGSWEVSSKPYSVPQWARDNYLRSPSDPLYEDSFGADHNFFAMALDENGKPIQDQSFLFWSDGPDKVKDPNYTNFVKRTPDRASGWVDIPIFNSFVPERGETGAWSVIPISGKFEYITGAGLPANLHVSTFVVFQRVKRGTNPVPTPDPLDPVETYLPYIPNANTSGNQATVKAVPSLNVRNAPEPDAKIIARIVTGTKVFATELKNNFYKVGSNAWVHKDWITFSQATQPSPVDNKTVTLAQFKQFMARILDINPKIVDAILQVESGNRYYNEFGKPVIRTELHLVQKCLNATVFNRHFRILGPKPWQGHEYRENEQQVWKKFHGEDSGGGQAAETKVHELVKSLNRACAFESMSMGAAQILGSNYKMFGYSSAEEMYNDFVTSEAAQIAAMFDYISDTDGWAALLANDLTRFAASYNGPGMADHYAKLIQNYLNTH